MSTDFSAARPDEDTRGRFLLGIVLWMAVTLVFLFLTAQLTAELFFVLSFVGLLTLTHVLNPDSSSTRWRRVVDWTIVTGLAVFMFLTTRRVLMIIN